MKALSAPARLSWRCGGQALLGAVPALGLVTLAVACGDSYVSGDEGPCLPPTCDPSVPSCETFDFTGDSCPGDWEFSGNTDKAEFPDVIGECENGKIHVACDDTLDIVAELWREVPDESYSIDIAAHIAVQEWDGGRVLALLIDNVPYFELLGDVAPSGRIRYELCREDYCDASFEAMPGEEHLVQFDVTDGGVQATVDCLPFAMLPAQDLLMGTWMRLEFGRMNGAPIDGTIDDVLVSFR